MNTAQHTPGPWNVTRIAYDIARGIDSGVREVKAVRNGGYKRYIADVRSIDSQGIDNTEANAALIAAAPDMLEALRAASEWLNDMGCEHNETEPDRRCTVCIVNQAITKAEGRT